MGKIRVTRRVKGVTLSINPLGIPTTIRSNRGPKEMEEVRKRRDASMIRVLQHASLQEQDIIREHNERAGAQWEVQDEEDDDWRGMDHNEHSEGWMADEEPTDALHELIEELRQDNIDVDVGSWRKSKRVDPRSRADRVLRQQVAWSSLYPDMVEAYLKWDYTGAPVYNNDGPGHSAITVIDIFETHTRIFPLLPNQFLIPTMLQFGYLGNSPLNPSCAFHVRLLEFFRVLNSRCPQLSIQKFIRSLCDLRQTAYVPSLRYKFSTAYDAYLQILIRIQSQIQAELGRDTPDWRLRNACPACTFKVPDEPPMPFSMLIAIDGNNSLRRMPKAIRKHDGSGRFVVSEYTERHDGRQMHTDLYLSNEYIDEYKDEVKKQPKSVVSTQLPAASSPPTSSAENLDHPVLSNAGALPADGLDKPTPCVERWTNLADESYKKMWGVFHETGIFLAVCRHGIALLVCDMIRSGELAKYPLALLDKMIDVYGSNLLVGYDIGCGFATTANRSPKVGPKVRASQCRFCVGSFHGHAHCRICQLDWHPLYIDGCGLEDFETCERCFSESNAVAGATRHASTFHRRQAILNHFTRWNLDKYSDISNFISNNYRQALHIIAENSNPLADAMRALNIPSMDTFRQWVIEEKIYLLTLKHQANDDYQMMRIEYVKTLQRLEAARSYFEVTSQEWVAIPLIAVSQDNFYQTQSTATQSVEATRLNTAKARGLDSVLTLQGAARDLEIKLGIEEKDRWTPEHAEWKLAEGQIDQAEYLSAIDKLEGLVVARLFELSKLHQAGTGVKLRTHIAKALKQRSKAIRKAVTQYNSVAVKIDKPNLDIDTVLQYVFLAEFDLLREGRRNIASQPWMQSAEREATLLHFKLQRAQEEIFRLNIELKRLHLYIQQETAAWDGLILRLQDTKPSLAYQAQKHLKLLSDINRIHERRIMQIELLDGYTGFKLFLRDDNRHGEEDDNGEDDESVDDRRQEAIDATLSVIQAVDY